MKYLGFISQSDVCAYITFQNSSILGEISMEVEGCKKSASLSSLLLIFFYTFKNTLCNTSPILFLASRVFIFVSSSFYRRVNCHFRLHSWSLPIIVLAVWWGLFVWDFYSHLNMFKKTKQDKKQNMIRVILTEYRIASKWIHCESRGGTTSCVSWIQDNVLMQLHNHLSAVIVSNTMGT